jgi:hypothetical protein
LGSGLGAHLSALPGFGYAGVALTPELGWKIDLGEPGHWFIEPYIKMPLTLSLVDYIDFMPGIPLVAFGLGYSF